MKQKQSSYYNNKNINKNFQKDDKKQYLNIPEKYLNLLPKEQKKWPSFSALSNYILLSVPLDNFCYTDKIDGLHIHLLIFEKKIYNVSKTEKILLIENIEKMNFNGDCIIEAELYNDCYFIFDVVYLNGVDYSDKYIYERIGSIKQYMNELGPSFKLKNYNTIPDLNFLLEYIKKDKSPEGNDIDGVILQRTDKPYFQENLKEFFTFKLKPPHLNTIDFLLKYNYNKKYYNLYLKGNYYEDYYNNFKKLPKEKSIYKINDVNKAIDGNKCTLRDKEKVLIYFDSPFYPNLGIMKIDKNWNKNNYNERAIKLIDELIEEMDRNPQLYNNKIVELSLTGDKKWVPLKIRSDKTLPNSYRVGLSNISIIFDPIKPSESIYFQKKILLSSEDQDIIHKINQIFRKYIIEMYINYYGKHSSVIDLCGGRGADEFNLYSNGVSNFFVIDSDSTALKRYFERTYKLVSKIWSNNKKEYSPLTDHYYDNLSWCREYITLNFLNYKLDKDYEKIKEDLSSRNEFCAIKKKVDIVIMNFAIHYLCDEKEKITKLCEFVQDVLSDNGIFIITYFDGDEVLKNKEKNVAKIGPFNIEIIKEEDNVTIAKMPLPTIKTGNDINDIYREEPLVHKKMISEIENYFDLYEEYYIYDKCKEYVDKIMNVDKYIDYYKLIKVGIYNKKENN